MMNRKFLYKIIEKDDSGSTYSLMYDYIMALAIITSIVPLLFKEYYAIFHYFDLITLYIFVIDYLVRWSTSDYYLNKSFAVSFVKYPFTFFAILDLVSILPSLYLLSPIFKILRISRLFKMVRILRFTRYSKHLATLGNVLKKESGVLVSVLIIALSYIFTTAIIMFNVEPERFESFFMALYWATTALTTVGYGDIFPTTDIGRVVSMISSLFGVAIIALPSGIITAGYMSEIKCNQNKIKE